MVTKREFERIAKEAFKAMPALYHPSDSIIVVGSSRNAYWVCYYSKRFSETNYNRTSYDLLIGTRKKEVLEEWLFVCDTHQKRGFGREMVSAKGRLLRMLGFKKAVTWGAAEGSEGFWKSLGYSYDEKKDEYVKKL